MKFNLERTLRSGQFFQWRPDGDAFVVRHRGMTARLRDVNGSEPAWVRRLFALDRPDVSAELARDPLLRPTLESYAGLRVMRQDPWECLFGFILSSVSNIPRIQRQVWTLERIPRPHELGDLAPLRAGFRAAYLTETAKRVDDAFFDRLRGMSDDDARAALMELPGVGRKIANCVLLYAYERLGAFPVDVWIRRAMKRLAGRRRPDAAYEAMAARRWGNLAGYAQLYLFAAARHG